MSCRINTGSASRTGLSHSRGAGNRQRIAYTGSDAPLPPDSSPQRVYSRLFSGAVDAILEKA